MHKLAHTFAWPFQVGQAVYYVPGLTAFKARPLLFPAVVTRVQRAHVGIWREDGARRTVQAYFLVYRGYCAACQVPAVERSGLRCPQCEAPAVNELPPDELVLRWYPVGEDTHARNTRYALATGCTWGEAIKWRRNSDHAAFVAMLHQTGLYNSWARWEAPWNAMSYRELNRCALLGDEAGFLAAFQAAGGRAEEDTLRDILTKLGVIDSLPTRRQPPEPPIGVVWPAADSEPDSNTGSALDVWLDEQFRRAA